MDYKNKYSVVQLQNKTSKETINIGIILYLNDEQTQYKLYLPKNAFIVSKYYTCKTEEHLKIHEFYQLPENERTLNLFPASFHVTKPETFKETRYLHSSIEGFFDELIETFITIKELAERNSSPVEVCVDRIQLQLTINSYINDSQEMECPGHTNLHVSIQHPCGDDIEVLGYLDFVLLNIEHDRITNLLDYSDTTEHFIHLFENNNDSLLSNYEKSISKYFAHFDNSDIIPILFTKAFIFEEYRGKGLLKDVYKRVIKLLKIGYANEVVFLKAFAENDSDTKKLKSYYEEVGFITLEHYMDGYTMCHPASYKLLSDINRCK